MTRHATRGRRSTRGGPWNEVGTGPEGIAVALGVGLGGFRSTILEKLSLLCWRSPHTTAFGVCVGEAPSQRHILSGRGTGTPDLAAARKAQDGRPGHHHARNTGAAAKEAAGGQGGDFRRAVVPRARAPPPARRRWAATGIIWGRGSRAARRLMKRNTNEV